MSSGPTRSLLILVLSEIFALGGSAQTMPFKPAAPKRIEPGLKNAVRWEWHVEPSDPKDWGLQLPESKPIPSPTPTPSTSAAALPQSENRPVLYEVKHGDALILIGKKFGMTVFQIKTFNGLKDDRIRVGQILKIPTLAQLSAIAPAPTPIAPAPKKHKSAQKKEAAPTPTPGIESDKLRIEIFLDREQFSAGPIVAEPGPTFTGLTVLYQSAHEDARDDALLEAKAQATVPDVFGHYKLKPEDFRFIAPPRAETAEAKPTPGSTRARPGKPVSRPAPAAAKPLSYEELMAMPMLAYRTPWEFVAERFHCQEAYLRNLNDKLPAVPAVGAEFRVPNVVPFEIEKAFDEPLQPQADPKNPITATVIGLSQLNIYQRGELVAVMPMSPARPGLHGRNTWTILDVIPRPRLATLQKVRQELIPKVASASASASPQTAVLPSQAVLTSEQYLAAGPRNPVGILWINLAKAKSTEPLPYGLHGTSIPDQMTVEQSLGGFRLTNWDIARAVRHLPSGTPLEWK
ncbi:MAG: LysM peptidoglycan-binding domain-containing protein [Verrucomicrobia bacterium]|nr:LysM peptidoglycan-binding domain-containing protein [Verrucomicrobiota bacterium]